MKKLILISSMFLLFQGIGCMETKRESIKDQFLIEEKEPSDSLDDCKEISRAFCKKMYRMSAEKLNKLVNRQYEVLQDLWAKKESELHILVAKDEAAKACLAACLAYRVNSEEQSCVIRMIARNQKYSKSDVLADLVDAISLIHDDINMQKIYTCIRKSALMRELLINLGFKETNFLFEGCRKDKWQGYEKLLKKIK